MEKDEQAKLREALEASLNLDKWRVEQKEAKWRIVSKADARMLELPVHELEAQLHQTEDRQEKTRLIEAFAARVVRTLPVTEQPADLHEGRHRIYPIVRSASVQAEGETGRRLLSSEHTAETRVFYVLDFGESYVIIDEEMAAAANVTNEEVRRWAMHNLRKLPNEPKMDFVADNQFYFFSQDYYAASRLLNRKLLADMQKKMKGEMAVAVPHQEVLIMADLRNSAGYNIMGQMVMKFYSEASIPITPLPMTVERDLELTPIVVLPEKIKQTKKYK